MSESDRPLTLAELDCLRWASERLPTYGWLRTHLPPESIAEREDRLARLAATQLRLARGLAHDAELLRCAGLLPAAAG
jgi:hypothetical protein